MEWIEDKWDISLFNYNTELTPNKTASLYWPSRNFITTINVFCERSESSLTITVVNVLSNWFYMKCEMYQLCSLNYETCLLSVFL